MDNYDDAQEDIGMYEDDNDNIGLDSDEEEDDGQPAVTFRYEEDEDIAGNAAKKQKEKKRGKMGEQDDFDDGELIPDDY